MNVPKQHSAITPNNPAATTSIVPHHRIHIQGYILPVTVAIATSIIIIISQPLLIPVLRVLVTVALAADIIIIISLLRFIILTTEKAAATLFTMMSDLAAASVEDLAAASGGVRISNVYPKKDRKGFLLGDPFGGI
jgi:hypothetical protein